MTKEVKNTVEVLESRELLGVDFKIYGTTDEPLFLANDVKEWIGHSNVSVMIRNVDEDEKVLNNVYTLGGNQEMLFLTENGIYEVLMLSRKPIAKQFKTEVKKILKQIRLTGGYIPVKTEESDEDLMARAFIVAQNTIAKKDALLKEQEKKLLKSKETIDNLENTNKYLVAEALSKTDIQKIKMLISALGTHIDGAYGHAQAYNTFYTAMSDKYGMRFKARKGIFENKFKTEKEVALSLKTIISICSNRGINVNKILNR